jgi:membrane associated rhomboid family serine protease
MGIYERDYTQDNSQRQYEYMPQMRFGLPKITTAVKWLIIANLAIFLVGSFARPNIVVPPYLHPVNFFDCWFSVFPFSIDAVLQVWRLFTYQFLHGDILHIFFNMLGLFFLGPALERQWGWKKFLIFYLCCGAAGGLFYTALVAIGYLPALPMVGASGSILGLLAACAILFPAFVVFIFIFPVPIRLAAIGFTIVFLVNVIVKGQNAGGEAAHLAGMVTGAAYCLLLPIRTKITMKFKASRWKKQLLYEQKLQTEVDRLLEKVHENGIHSLTAKEKKTLKKATQIEKTKKGLYHF